MTSLRLSISFRCAVDRTDHRTAMKRTMFCFIALPAGLYVNQIVQVFRELCLFLNDKVRCLTEG